MTGVIINILLNKGFGFIRGTEDGQSRFFHVSNVKPITAFESMHVGMQVEFTPFMTDNGKGNGFRALEVRPVPLEDPGEQVVHE